MFISVVVPLYNKKEYIQRAIQSVLSQSYSQFEVIVVNDGSTDGSEAVVKAMNAERIRLISQANKGAAAARNTGVRLAKSEWVAFLDADDEYLKDFLKKTVQFITDYKDNNLAFVGTNYYIKDHNLHLRYNDLATGIFDYADLFKDQASPNNSSSTIANKRKLLQIGGFPEDMRFFEDWLTWFRLSFIGEFGFIADPLSVYHYNPTSLSKQSKSADFFNDARRFVEILSNNMIENRLSPQRQKKVWRCLNEFSVNIASMLAGENHKKLAMKMLKCLNIKEFLIHPTGRLRSLILHLLVPALLKPLLTKIRRVLKYLYVILL